MDPLLSLLILSFLIFPLVLILAGHFDYVARIHFLSFLFPAGFEGRVNPTHLPLFLPDKKLQHQKKKKP
jgi:hypothetical protein